MCKCESYENDIVIIYKKVLFYDIYMYRCNFSI